MSKHFCNVKIEIELTHEDMNAILVAVNYGEDEGARRLEDMSRDDLIAFQNELRDGAEWIKDDLMENIDSACVNGEWMIGWEGDLDEHP